MEPYLFLSVIGVTVTAFLALLVWVAERGQPEYDAEAGTLRLRHSVLLRGFALFAAFGIPLGVTVLVFFNPPRQEGDVGAIIAIYALFACLGAPLLWEATRFTLLIVPDGLDCRSPWRGTRFLAWDEVVDVSWSSLSSWFIIRARDGYKFRVPLLVPGVTRFLEECEKHLPASALTGARPGYERLGRPFPDRQGIPPLDLGRWDQRRR